MAEKNKYSDYMTEDLIGWKERAKKNLKEVNTLSEQWDLSKKSTPEKVLRAFLFNPASILSIPKNIKHIKNAFISVKNDDSDNSLLKKTEKALKKEAKDYSWLTLMKRGGAVKKYSHGGIVSSGHQLTYKRRG